MPAHRPLRGHRNACGRPSTAQCTVLLLLSGLVAASVVPVIAAAQTMQTVCPSQRGLYDGHIAEAEYRFQLPAAWIRAVMNAESKGDARAVSPKGAMGLMQIMPETWAELRVRHRLGRDVYDPHDNIIAGAAYIRELFDRYGSPGWVAAYNAGRGRYEEALTGRPLPPETRAYVTVVARAIADSGAANPIMIATADTVAWMQAPLFVVLPAGKPAVGSVSVNRSREDVPKEALARDLSGIVPQPGDLFIARGGEGIKR